MTEKNTPYARFAGKKYPLWAVDLDEYHPFNLQIAHISEKHTQFQEKNTPYGPTILGISGKNKRYFPEIHQF